MKQTRFKLTFAFGVIIAILCALGMFKNMESVALVLGGALAGIVGKYNHDETKRPSNK